MVKGARDLHCYIAVNLEEPSVKYPGKSYNNTENFCRYREWIIWTIFLLLTKALTVR